MQSFVFSPAEANDMAIRTATAAMQKTTAETTA
jgi:hypothetical protein